MSRPRTDPAIRFWRFVQVVADCWLWTGARTWDGYGRFRLPDRTVRAHRYAWELLVGPPPKGVADHLCLQRHCVNPDHLHWVTVAENTQRRRARRLGLYIRPVAAALVLTLGIAIGPLQTEAHDNCRPEPASQWAPAGVICPPIYGNGIASHWQGPGVARNDCVWPWTRCVPITITSLDTGRSVTVTPTMWCHCYTGTSDERIVDLDPAAVAALGLDWSRGLYAVHVEPAAGLQEDAPPLRAPPAPLEQEIGEPFVGTPDTSIAP